MIKKKILILLIILNFTNLVLASNIFIEFTIDDKPITNHDLSKEVNYLKFVNPSLIKIDDEIEIKKIAQKSLIEEVIKEKELAKSMMIKKQNSNIDKIIKNLYSELGYSSDEEFSLALKNKQTYNISELKNKISTQLFWNELIYKRFGNLVVIDENKLKKNIKKNKNQINKEYFLSEIVLKQQVNKPVNDLFVEIKSSINEIGFENTALVYSISETSRSGGKVGWVNELSLPEQINQELKNLEVGELSKIVKINNNYIIFKINDLKIKNIEINEKKELEILIQKEFEKKLSQFSRIYLEKIRLNYSIYE